MDVSLTPELEQFIHQQVESGTYPSASEVVRESLRVLRERDDRHRQAMEELRREIQVGIDQAERGQTRPLTAHLIGEIKARGRRRRAEHSDPSPA